MINLIHIAHSEAHDIFAINQANGRKIIGTDNGVSSITSRDVTLNRMAMNGQNNVFTQPSVEIVSIERVVTAEDIEDIFSLLN